MPPTPEPPHHARAPAGASRLRHGHLLALGWGLALLLPLVAIGLIALDYRQVEQQAADRTRLIADAVERQLRDRLLLVGRQLRSAAHEGVRDGWVIPMSEVVVRGATARDRARDGRVELGTPVRRKDRWMVPVSFSTKGRTAGGLVDASLFSSVVSGYSLARHDFISVIHDQGALLARSMDNWALVGRDMRRAGLFSPERRGLREGSYAGDSVIDGVERSYYFRRLDAVPVAIMVASERRGFVQTWGRPAIAILMVASLIALAWGWLVRRFASSQHMQARLIAEQRETLAAVRSAQERLRQAHQLARLSEFEWDAERDQFESHGMPGAEDCNDIGTIDDALARVHPDDRARVHSLAKAVFDHGEPVEARYRILDADGTVRHVYTRGARVERDDGRRVLHGVRQDITALVEAQFRAERAEGEYRFLFEHNPLPMWVFDRDSLAILAVNDAMVAHYGYSREQLLGRSMLDIRPPEQFAAMREAAKVASQEGRQGRVWTHLHKDGRVMRMQIFSHDIDFEGRSARLVAAQDVTEREQADERFQLVARATSDAVYDYDIARGQLWWSESYFTRFGYTPVPHEPVDLWVSRIHSGDRERVHSTFRAAIASGQAEWQEQYRYRRGDGTYAMVLDRGFILRDGTGQSIRMVGGMLDISERQNYEDQLAWRATHDELTGLPNRQLLQDRLQQALLNAQRYGRECALIFIDLDDFKLVNDSLGHSAGDRVLREVAQRLTAIARETDTVARFGGDEFVVVLTEQTGEQGVAEVIARITREITRPLTVGNAQHTLTASIGWCRYPDAGNDVETLLMHGDLAMYQAKRQGRNRAVAFHRDFVDGMSRRLQLVGQLRKAIERNEFVPVFQPLFDRDERPVALETLLRWQHPERGLLLPGEFIAVCEESGLIVEVGRMVLHQAARHYRRLADMGLGHMRIAVNVSPAQFNDELVQHVREAMEAHGVPADALELEITEGLLMTDPERAIELMRQITALGVSFSVDDFGTGYSSLAYLKRFPIDRLKIDRSFVRDLGTDDDDAAICNSIIGLAHALDIRTVAEGVETALQLDWLRTRRIDEVQGYLLGRPMPFDDLLPLLSRHVGVVALPGAVPVAVAVS